MIVEGTTTVNLPSLFHPVILQQSPESVLWLLVYTSHGWSGIPQLECLNNIFNSNVSQTICVLNV